MSREVMQQALEALELLAKLENPCTKWQVRKPKDGGPIVTIYPHKVATDAATLLRESLAQPEPVAWRIKDFKQVALHASGGSGGTGYIDGVWDGPEQQKPPLTDEEIDALLPEPDGTTEEVKRKVEYRPGLWADEVGVDDAWSRSLVIEIIRAVEKHHGIGDRT